MTSIAFSFAASMTNIDLRRCRVWCIVHQIKRPSSLPKLLVYSLPPPRMRKLLESGAIFLPIIAASMAMVPEPQQGSAISYSEEEVEPAAVSWLVQPLSLLYSLSSFRIVTFTIKLPVSEASLHHADLTKSKLAWPSYYNDMPGTQLLT